METGKQDLQGRRASPSTRAPVYLSTFSRFFLWLLPLFFLLIAFFFPLSRIFALTLDIKTLTTENFLLVIRVLSFTFYQAILLKLRLILVS